MSTKTLNTPLQSHENTKKMVTLAMLSAIAYAVMFFLRIPIWSFLKYDPKDIVIIISGFIYGPFSAFMVSLVVSLIEMITVSDTGWIGFAMNVLSTCAFVCPAAFIYSKNRTKNGSIIGLVVGVVAMTAVMLLWNYIVTPLYMETPRETVKGMLLPIFLPFNLFKGGLNMAITLILYKPIISALRRASLLPPSNSDGEEKRGYGMILLGAIMLVTVILLILALRKII